MAPKSLQYIMGHSDISITLNVYTHVESNDTTTEYRNIMKNLNAKDNETKKTINYDMNSRQYTMYDLDRESDIYVPQVDSVEDEEIDDEIQ